MIYVVRIFFVKTNRNPLNAELNPICHLLALLGAHHILHVSRIRVNVIYVVRIFFVKTNRNLLNAQLNPICHLLALLGAHRILHFSGVRVKVNTVHFLGCKESYVRTETTARGLRSRL